VFALLFLLAVRVQSTARLYRIIIMVLVRLWSRRSQPRPSLTRVGLRPGFLPATDDLGAVADDRGVALGARIDEGGRAAWRTSLAEGIAVPPDGPAKLTTSALSAGFSIPTRLGLSADFLFGSIAGATGILSRSPRLCLDLKLGAFEEASSADGAEHVKRV
jgi:hypothetical protein